MLIEEERLVQEDDPVSAPASLRIRAHLDSMRNLADGWLEGAGIAPSAAGLDWLAEAFARQYPEESPRPYLYPTAEGGVQAEWSFECWRVSLEINLKSHRGNWFALDLETDSAEERELRCDETPDWQWLVRRIHDMSRGAG